jgi:two-component system sensor histidine kinase KdpD
MLPFRTHLSIATAALVLVVPVIGGVAIGGLFAGFVSVLAGFIVYDVGFIPPYGTLTVESGENLVVLLVYVVVMAVGARLVAHLRTAQEDAQSRAASARHLLDLSELLLAENPDVAATIVGAVRDAFGIDSVALLLSVSGHLKVVAAAGSPFDDGELARLQPEAHLPVPLSTGSSGDAVQALALASSGRPIGMLVLRNAPTTRAVREALPILANHLAVALERGQLRERMHHAELLEEVDRLRQALVGAVSHDLRTPLATIKVASSTLVASSESLSSEDRIELAGLIDQQTDRLTRLVSNLLDMTRIQSGALEVRPKVVAVNELVGDALSSLRSSLRDRAVELLEPSALPLVRADPLLIAQVLANLLDNANRHGPPGTAILIEANAPVGGRVMISVSDEGTGIRPEEREAIFQTFVRFDTGGRSGLGLAIAKAFVEAHGDRIWVEEAPRGGARFVFTLPVASSQTVDP